MSIEVTPADLLASEALANEAPREQLYRIKPLEWRIEVTPADLLVVADIATFALQSAVAVVSFVNGSWCWYVSGNIASIPCESLEAGEAACEAHYRARMLAGLEPVMSENPHAHEYHGYTVTKLPVSGYTIRKIAGGNAESANDLADAYRKIDAKQPKSSGAARKELQAKKSGGG